ncbi:class I SAM-dependent methyltransferase [bacterium]|nr:class I SAM-dependent methyltransferase [bacterium]
MKISGGLEEQGIVVGNAFDKYGSRNPIVKWIMIGFHRALDELVGIARPESIHEVGCGEGFWVMHWLQQGIEAKGSDFSSQVIALARQNSAKMALASDVFLEKSIYDLQKSTDGADLVICCEVLEHLEEPEEGLKALQRITQNHLIVSVPREPVWRMLNMLRGKYLSKLGNTPGHIQHWSQHGFIELVQKYFEVTHVKAPLPWTMLLCRPLH